jgi:hypothetical protein
MIRPWLEHYEKDYAPGCLIFAKQDVSGRSPLITVADVPTMNYLMQVGRSVNQNADKYKYDSFEFLGIFRNDAGKQIDHLGFPRYNNPKQRLIQCDVYGRARVANFWGKKLHTGQSVGFALVVEKVTFAQQPNRAKTPILGQNKYALQLVPTLDGKRVQAQGPSTDLEKVTPTPNLYNGDGTCKSENAGKMVKHWHIGVVSQAAFEPPTQSNIDLALNNSQQRTHLPQIEILMI